jgi:hypothetical protein
MPNVCYCMLRVSGNSTELIRFRDMISLDEGIIRTFLPRPSVFDNIHSGFCSLPDGRVLTVWRTEEDPFSNPLTPPIEIPLNEVRVIERQYGATNGCDWCYLNWGSKSGDYGTTLVNDSAARGVLLYRFISSWNPPTHAFVRISRRFPSLWFRLRYHEPLGEYRGVVFCRNGRLLRSRRVDSCFE